MVSPRQFKNRNWIKYQQQQQIKSPYTAEKTKRNYRYFWCQHWTLQCEVHKSHPKNIHTKQYLKYINNKRAKQLNAYSFYLCNHHWNRPHWSISLRITKYGQRKRNFCTKMYASQRENKLRMKERTNEQKKHIKLEKYQQQQPKKERIIQPDSGRGSVTERET